MIQEKMHSIEKGNLAWNKAIPAEAKNKEHITVENLNMLYLKLRG